jgi:enoyl-CoA hydratase/carnithine racemase
MPDDPLVLYDCADRVATVALNRPDKLNAMNEELVGELVDAMRRFDQDPHADVAVLCGHGRAFSAGADVQQGQMRSSDELARMPDPMGPNSPLSGLLTGAINCKPVVCAVHGYALGMALGLVLQCDLIAAEAETRFQVTETPRGLGGYRHWALFRARQAGPFGDEVCLTGRFFTAEEALAAGLVAQVTAKGEVLQAARALAQLIARNPPLSVRETVRVRRAYMSRVVREVALETRHLRLELTDDFAEAVKAFAEKRPPGPFKAR